MCFHRGVYHHAKHTLQAHQTVVWVCPHIHSHVASRVLVAASKSWHDRPMPRTCAQEKRLLQPVLAIPTSDTQAMLLLCVLTLPMLTDELNYTRLQQSACHPPGRPSQQRAYGNLRSHVYRRVDSHPPSPVFKSCDARLARHIQTERE